MARVNEIQGEINALEQMLRQTEGSVSGFTEGLFNVFKESTALNLVSNLVSFMVNVKKDYATTMLARIQAEARIAELKALLDE